jgi:hypothetical protein
MDALLDFFEEKNSRGSPCGSLPWCWEAERGSWGPCESTLLDGLRPTTGGESDRIDVVEPALMRGGGGGACETCEARGMAA